MYFAFTNDPILRNLVLLAETRKSRAITAKHYGL